MSFLKKILWPFGNDDKYRSNSDYNNCDDPYLKAKEKQEDEYYKWVDEHGDVDCPDPDDYD